MRGAWRRKPTLPREALDLLRPAEVAVLAGVEQADVWRWKREGLLLAEVETPGGHARFLRSEVERFLAATS
jgi:predicted site-specific integrase-resolvase